jgi:hypothetical protein
MGRTRTVRRCGALIVASIALFLAGPTSAAAESLIQNGSFEGGTIEPWETDGNIDLVPNQENGGFWEAAAGDWSVDLTGSTGSPGYVGQTVPTVPGADYLIEFATSVNVHGCGVPYSADAYVTWDGVVEKEITELSGTRTVDDMQWTRHAISATAVDEEATLNFVSETEGICGVTLDDVSVTALDPDADTDGDAILDHYELNGFDANTDGVIDVDLPAMGADPNVKDIFIEVDSMTGHEIQNVPYVAPLAIAFAAHGIQIHVDNGANSTMNWKTGEKWGALSDSEINLPHQFQINRDVTENLHDWTQFDAIKEAHIGEARTPFFHYVLSVHQIGSDPKVAGKARGIPSSDFMVALGRCINEEPKANPAAHCPPDGVSVGNTFMHELGHNLSLRHGGPDNLNWKPNYPSIMNYYFAWKGVPGGLYGGTNYSEAAITLDELTLKESEGLPSSVGPVSLIGYQTGRLCPDRTQELTSFGSSVDWNCDKIIMPPSDPGQTVDVTGDGHITPLTGRNDWATLNFNGGVIGDSVINPVDPPTVVGTPPEPGTEDFQRAARLFSGDSTPPSAAIEGATSGIGSVSLLIRGSDGQSLDKLLVYVDGGDPAVHSSTGGSAVSVPLSFTSGSHSIRAVAIDHGLNTAEATANAVVLDPPTSTPAAPAGASVPGPTGLQDAALKKCAKKKSKQARKKCRKKARRLPL